jgi:hypothetical protein
LPARRWLPLPTRRSSCHAPHAGAVVALARSPFVEGLVLSVADWGFKLWRGDDPTPLFASPMAAEAYTAGASGEGEETAWRRAHGTPAAPCRLLC